MSAPQAPATPMMGPRPPTSVQRAKDPRGTARRLAVYFAPFRTSLVLVLLAVVIYSLLGLVGPYLMSVAIDRYIAGGDAEGLATFALVMLAAFVANNGFQIGSNWVMARISQYALRDLRRDLFAHVQTLPLSFFEEHAAGDLMSRLTNDVDAVNQAVSQNITSLLASVLSMVGILVMMFVLDARLAVASLFVVPLMFAFTRFVAVYTRTAFRTLQKSLGDLNGVMEESIGGQRVVKVFGRDESVASQFAAENEAVYQAGVQANTYALLLMPLTAVLGNFFVIVLAGLGGWLALEGLVTVGVIAAFISYGQGFVNPLRQISLLYNTLQAALAGAERVLALIDTPSEIDAPASSPLPEHWNHVTFDHVSFGYPDATAPRGASRAPNKLVLKDVSLDASPGQIVALVGPTGAGKTTIINLLTRFYEVNEGTIRIDGIDLRAIPKATLRRHLGLVLQDTFLFSASVLENIRYGRLDATDEEVMEAARLADADPFIRQLPSGYHTVLSERAGNLSQGQRQLLSIARTLLADPSILILDEATSSVDTRTEARIQASLLRLMKGRTSFVIAHRLSTIRDADQVLVIDGGTILERGTHEELLRLRGAYHRLYLAQFKGEELEGKPL